MRRFDDLTGPQQKFVVMMETRALIDALVQETIEFDDEKNEGDLQQRINTVLKKAPRKRKHSFLKSRLGEELEKIALALCQEAIYVFPEERVIQIPELEDFE